MHSSAGPQVPFEAPEPLLMWASAWASAGSSSELECSAVQLAAIPYRVSNRVFVYRRRDVCSGCGFTSPFTAFIGCFAQCGGDSVRSPMPRCHGVRVYTTIALYDSFGYLFYACPSLKCPVGLCIALLGVPFLGMFVAGLW